VLSAVLLVPGLKLLTVPTPVIGLVLLLSLVGLLGAWLGARLSGRTLRDASRESSTKILADAGRALHAEEAA
jgi:hypothetical protein